MRKSAFPTMPARSSFGLDSTAPPAGCMSTTFKCRRCRGAGNRGQRPEVRGKAMAARFAWRAGLCFAFLPVIVAAERRGFAQTREEYDRARERMVSEYLEKEGIKNRRVLAAMRRV